MPAGECSFCFRIAVQDFELGWMNSPDKMPFSACHMCMIVLRKVMQSNDKYLLCLYLDGVCDFATRMLKRGE